MHTKTGKPRTSSTNRAKDLKNLKNEKPVNLKITRKRIAPRQSSRPSEH